MKPVKAQSTEIVEMATLGSASTERRLTPAEFASASRETLETVILSRMNLARNLRREIDAMAERMAEALADAKVAEMLLRLKISREKEPSEP